MNQLSQKSFLLLLLTLVFNPVLAQYYWVGDGGNWSDFGTHWATSSGGSTFHTSAPSTSDDVFFDANSFSSGSQIVTLDIDGSANNLDFTGVTNTPTLAGAAARALTVAGDLTFVSGLDITFSGTISLTNSGDITIEVGDAIKTIPNLTFPNSIGTVTINSGLTTNRITFGNITLSGADVTLRIDETNSTDSNPKTFGNISLPDDCNWRVSGDNGSGFGAADGLVFNGTIDTGSGARGVIRSDYMQFNADVTLGTNNRLTFNDQFEMLGANTFTIGGTSGNGIRFNRDATIEHDININGDATFRFDQDTNLQGNVEVASSATVNFNTNGESNNDVNISGTTDIRSGATLNVGDGTNTPFTFGSTVTCEDFVQLVFQNGTGDVSFTTLVVGGFNIIQFNSNNSSTTSFSGNLTSLGGCSTWRRLESDVAGDQAALSFTAAQTVSGNLIRDLNVSGATFTANSGNDEGNNSPSITFNNHTPDTYYWIVDAGNWSSTTSWSTTSGGASGSCIPYFTDDVVFDGSSFGIASPTVTMDLERALVNDIDWTGVTETPSWESGATDSLFVYGNTTLNSNVSVANLNGPVIFTMQSAGTNTITSNGGTLNDVVLDFTGGTWTAADAMDIDGNLSITNGTLSPGSNTITVGGDWTVEAGGAFTFATSTVEFDGSGGTQTVDMNSNTFYNVTINRGASGNVVSLSSPMTISNDLTLTVGRLYDEGNQISGSSANTLTASNGTRLRIGDNASATTFPANFSTVSLGNGSRVEYHAQVDQDIAALTYGNLSIQGGGTSSRNKTLQGAITVNRNLTIDDYNNLVDNGFQITGSSGRTLRMDANSSLTLGNATTTTQFPLNYDDFTIDANTTIVYASGQNDLQTIKALDGVLASYGNLTLTNTSGTSRTKNLEGNIDVRGNLTVGVDNVLDVTAANDFSMNVQGDVTVGGTINFQESTFTINGSAQQTLDFGGATADLYELIINNTAGVVINDNLNITGAGSIDFQDGIVSPQSSEVITFQDAATVISVSDGSHVNGAVEKIGNGSTDTDPFTFPIGNGTTYRPISISAPGSDTDAFQAEYFGTNPDPLFDTGSLDGSLERVSSLEYWVLDVTNGTPTVNVTLSWDDNSDVGNLTDLRVARWSTAPAQWNDEGNDGTTGNTSSGTITANSISTFSPFTLGSVSGSNPLPIELIDFKASLVDDVVEVIWTTATEINNDFFTLERSQNAITWDKIGEIDGAGNSSRVLDYFYVDANPLAEISYYRLKQTDFDGQFSYSEAVSVFNPKSSVIIYPNPATNWMVVDGFSEPVDVRILNLSGMEISTVKHYEGARIDISFLGNGLYIVEVLTGKQTIRNKLIVD